LTQAKEIETTFPTFLISCLDRVARFERAMDYDPLEAQSLRLDAVERELAELAADRRSGAAGRAPARPLAADRAFGG
jgi:hypothetical protein